MSPTSFAKKQREKDRRERAQAKAVRRAERRAATDPGDGPRPAADQGSLLAALADLHARFDDDAIDFDEFAAAKAEITRHLHVD